MKILIVALLATAAFAQQTAQDQRMQWWREARFGMFIHWGLYSALGGEWEGLDYGKEMGGGSAEHIYYRTRITRDQYKALATQFNPVKFNAAEWVRIAKDAGMKYIVITSKHHDGFSMYGTKASPYNIVDATPFKRDVIAELAAECRKQGIHFGVYYSHSVDWENRKRSWRNLPPPPPEYVDLVKKQLAELLTNYGRMSLLWFDVGDQYKDINTAYADLVKRLSPETIVSGRLGGHANIADYRSEGDRRIPPARVTGDVETPMTMRDNWGYDRDENNWKSVKDLLERFSLTVCRGANMLLNVGPTPEGTFTPEEIHRLRGIGQWMKVNAEAVYGTTASPFDFDFQWGSISQKPGKLYLHVLKWNPEGIAFPGLKTPVKRAYLLADSKRAPLKVTQNAGTTTVSVPAAAPSAYVAVIALELDGPLQTDPAVQGTYVWVKNIDIRLNEEKMERQRKLGWDPKWSWDTAAENPGR
jgi:alpha-L-fucosidase